MRLRRIAAAVALATAVIVPATSTAAMAAKTPAAATGAIAKTSAPATRSAQAKTPSATKVPTTSAAAKTPFGVSAKTPAVAAAKTPFGVTAKTPASVKVTAPAAAAKTPFGVSAKTPAAAKSDKPDKPAIPAKFSASGSVTAVNAKAGTVTVTVKGVAMTVGVPSTAKVTVNGKTKSVGDLRAGYRITMSGTKTGSAYTAAKVVASAAAKTPA